MVIVCNLFVVVMDTGTARMEAMSGIVKVCVSVCVCVCLHVYIYTSILV